MSRPISRSTKLSHTIACQKPGSSKSFLQALRAPGADLAWPIRRALPAGAGNREKRPEAYDATPTRVTSSPSSRDGTAILGPGQSRRSPPTGDGGKGRAFKQFADIDVYDIEVNARPWISSR